MLRIVSRVSRLLSAADMPPCVRAWYKRIVTVRTHCAPPCTTSGAFTLAARRPVHFA